MQLLVLFDDRLGYGVHGVVLGREGDAGDRGARGYVDMSFLAVVARPEVYRTALELNTRLVRHSAQASLRSFGPGLRFQPIRANRRLNARANRALEEAEDPPALLAVLGLFRRMDVGAIRFVCGAWGM